MHMSRSAHEGQKKHWILWIWSFIARFELPWVSARNWTAVLWNNSGHSILKPPLPMKGLLLFIHLNKKILIQYVFTKRIQLKYKSQNQNHCCLQQILFVPSFQTSAVTIPQVNRDYFFFHFPFLWIITANNF